MSISISETGGGGRDSLLLPLLSRESWMFAKDNPDRKKKKEKKQSDLSKISKSGNSLRNYTQQGNKKQVFRELMSSILCP